MIAEKKRIIRGRNTLAAAFYRCFRNREIANKIFKQNLHGHFLTLSEDETSVSYNYSGHRWERNGRRTLSLHRYIKKFIDNEIPHTELERSSKMTMSTLRGGSSIREARGQEIVEEYRVINAKSCMTGHNAWKTQIYADNPDKFRLIIYEDAFGCGRCLIAKNDDGQEFYSRIYSDSTHACDAIIKYLEKNEISNKPKGEVTCRLINEWFPSLDMFFRIKFVDEDTVVLNNKEGKYCTTSGYTDGYEVCPNCRHYSNFISGNSCRWCRRGISDERLMA